MDWDFIPRTGIIDGDHHIMVCYPNTQPKVTFMLSQVDEERQGRVFQAQGTACKTSEVNKKEGRTLGDTGSSWLC